MPRLPPRQPPLDRRHPVTMAHKGWVLERSMAEFRFIRHFVGRSLGVFRLHNWGYQLAHVPKCISDHLPAQECASLQVIITHYVVTTVTWEDGALMAGFQQGI
ncbi:hypothetical protein NDU88_006243 [Pleurodeles waltl]|uniref:Uncharacterized protein n=1 Tax=Pleurodeles waltl TaxID=8319 RepID=A0AAV7TWK0_PLEWA|nr:hypothetical protein NDU88_006243 [Pleurodeles waltl]